MGGKTIARNILKTRFSGTEEKNEKSLWRIDVCKALREILPGAFSGQGGGYACPSDSYPDGGIGRGLLRLLVCGG